MIFFLKPEERCEHFISIEVKKLWKVQLECMIELQKVCKKHNIQYYAGGGTLLGAVRHRGFIPWDDDMDVFMLEKDYYRFLKVAPNEIKDPFFFQSFETQDGFGPSISRIRKSNTTACTQFEYDTADENYNCGIFIDIFPLTSVNDNSLVRFFQRFNIFRYRAAIAGYERWRAKKRSMSQKGKGDILILYWKLCSFFMSHKELSEKFLHSCSSGGESSNCVGLIPFLGFQDKYIFKRSWFKESVDLPFEYISISCPSEYDNVLKHQYGNYKVFQKGTAIHSMAVFDADTPYKEKLKGVFE